MLNVYSRPPYFPLQRYLSTHTHSISSIPVKSPTVPFDTNLSLAIIPYTGPPTLTAHAADSFSHPRSVLYTYSITAPFLESTAAASILSPYQLLGLSKYSSPSDLRASTSSSSVVPFAYSQKRVIARHDGTRLDLLAALLEHISTAARTPASACLTDCVAAVNSRAEVICDSLVPMSMYQTRTGPAYSFRALQQLAALATAASASGSFTLTTADTAYAAHIVNSVINKCAVLSLLASTDAALMQPAQPQAQSSCYITTLGMISSAASQLAYQSMHSGCRMQLSAGPVNNSTTASPARLPALTRYYTKQVKLPLMMASSYGLHLPTSTATSSPGVALLSMAASATRTTSSTLDMTYIIPTNPGLKKMPSMVAVFPLYRVPAVDSAFKASVAVEPVDGTVAHEHPVFASKVGKDLEMPWDSRQAFEKMAQKTTVECFRVSFTSCSLPTLTETPSPKVRTDQHCCSNISTCMLPVSVQLLQQLEAMMCIAFS